MGQFFYRAVDQSGGHISGSIEAVDRRSAVVALTGQGHFVTELAEEAQAQGLKGASDTAATDLGQLLSFRKSKVSSKDVLAFTTQLSDCFSTACVLSRLP